MQDIDRYKWKHSESGESNEPRRNPLFCFREACRYTWFTVSHLRSIGVTVPTAINFARPRGTPILARSLQLRSRCERWCRRVSNTFSKGKQWWYTHEVHAHNHTRRGAKHASCTLLVSCKTDVHLPERIIFRGNRNGEH